MRSLTTRPNSSSPPETTRPSSRQSAASSGSDGKPKSAIALRKKQGSAGSVLVATSGRPARITKTTTTTTRSSSTSASASASPTPGRRPSAIASIYTPRSASPSIVTTATTRTPLRVRDKNAAPTRPTGPMKNHSTAAMSANNKQTAGTRQVQTPSLSAQAARGLNKQPLTPKIASRGLPAGQHQTVTVSTPLSRRGPLQRSESAQGSNNNRDDVTSPVQAFLSNNITPRSGSRQSRVDRVDSAGSTPTGTSNPDNDLWEAQSGLGIAAPPASKGDGLRRPVVSFSSPAEAAARQDPDSKFFYASEAAKPQTPQPGQQPRQFVPQQQQKAPTFFYANGTTVPEPRAVVSPSPFSPVVGTPPVPQDSLMSKFVYANGIGNSQPTAKSVVASSGPGSTVSTASKAPISRLGIPSTPAPGYNQQRPASPVKLASFSSTKNSSTSSLSTPRTNLGPIPALGPASVAQQRRSIPNVEATRPLSARGGHSRHGSVTTLPEPAPAAKFISPNPSRASSEASSPSNLSSTGFNPPVPTAAAGFASLLQATEDFTATTTTEAVTPDDVIGNDSAAVSGLQSPTKSSSQEQALTDLVASARRERKVQDLEITNASLEAINRTLERQLRKQTAEIRRYRRLSRSGRLSLNSVASIPGGSRSDRVVSGGSVAGGALARAGLRLEDLSEEEDSDAEHDAFREEEEEDDEDEDLSPSESGSAELSPGAMALRDARHRRRDEQRLQLDLSKHQQLLVDSQKMNQSLRRCLGWTEELIREGRRALEYKVRVSEVELGGRVLAPEDVEEHDHEHEHDDTQVGIEPEEETLHAVTFDLDGAASEQMWSKEPQDRDSGIDLPADSG